MQLRSLSLVITDTCNFDCSYCYKVKRDSCMAYSTAEKSLSFLLPYCTDESHLIFYGGEPLLALDLIKKTVTFARTQSEELGKLVHFSITTNGSLITVETAEYLADNRFHVVLSFDGLAQEIHRKKNSLKKINETIDLLKKHPDIELEVNAVFTPKSVLRLADSIQYIMDKDIEKIGFSLSSQPVWGTTSLNLLKTELERLVGILAGHFSRAGKIPVENYSKISNNHVSRCNGGQDRLTISSNGQVWGCDLFAEHFRTRSIEASSNPYLFGYIDDFIDFHKTPYPEVASNYARLSSDNYATPAQQCFLCEYLLDCGICPIDAAFSGLPIGQIPAHLCEIQKIKIQSRREFDRKIGPDFELRR